MMSLCALRQLLANGGGTLLKPRRENIPSGLKELLWLACSIFCSAAPQSKQCADIAQRRSLNVKLAIVVSHVSCAVGHLQTVLLYHADTIACVVDAQIRAGLSVALCAAPEWDRLVLFEFMLNSTNVIRIFISLQ